MTVLCVDDEPGMADLIGANLERFDDQFSVITATSAGEALELFEQTAVDCLVSDYDMPEMNGLVLLETIRAEHPELPFVLFTGRGSEEIASDAISAGVTDYMQKASGSDQYRLLAKRVRNAVTRYRLSREASTAREHAETILQTSPNAILVGIDGRCVYANPAAVELLAPLTKQEILDTPINSVLHSRDGEAAFRGVEDGTELFEQARLSLRTGDTGTPVEGTARQMTWDDSQAVVYVLQDVSQRVEYEQELEYRQSLLDSVFEASPDGIHIATDDWEIISYNDQFAELWDIPTNVLETGDGKLALESVLEDVADPETFVANIERQFDNPEESQRNQVRLTDGTVYDQYSAPVRSDDGTHHGYVWFYRDVTELTRLQATQQEAFDRMTDAVYAVDEDWTVTFMNERAEQLLQLDAEELLGEELWSAFPEAVDTEIYDRYQEAIRTGEPVSFETRYAPLDGVFEIRGFPSETGLTVYFRDITERQRTKSALQETVDALQELYEVASDPALSFETKQDRLLELGCAYLDLPYGFVTEISESTQTISTAHGSHELLQPGASCPLEESYCRKTVSNETGLLAVQDARVEGWTGDAAYERFELGTYIGGKVLIEDTLYGTICFAAHDPRERSFSEMERTFVELLSRWLSYELEQREQRLELEETNSQLEEFAGIVSHDLRNPLSVAEGYTELVAEECNSEHLERVEQAHERMAELIDDILMLARDGDVVGELTSVNLAALSEACWENVETASATLSIETGRTLVADESRLIQLLENLVRNAVEHGGDDVTITIGDLPDGFFVEDTGSGLPESIQEKLFESGYSTKAEGGGIGLRIVRQIVTAHGWEISATNGASGGARFEITGVETES